MQAICTAVALLAALAIIGIGVGYLWRPLSMARSFGLPPPPGDPTIPWWLRLKGSRDIASGVAIPALAAWAPGRPVGVALLALALIPLGDMSVVLAGRGRPATALGVHGVTALVMILAATPLIMQGA